MDTMSSRIIEEELESVSAISDRIDPINIPQIVLDRSQTKKMDQQIPQSSGINRQLKPQDIKGYMEEQKKKLERMYTPDYIPREALHFQEELKDEEDKYEDEKLQEKLEIDNLETGYKDSSLSKRPPSKSKRSSRKPERQGSKLSSYSIGSAASKGSNRSRKGLSKTTSS